MKLDDIHTEQPRRSYRMGARAEAAAATEEHVLSAGIHLFGTQPYEQISLEAIATRAQVTVQTVIRRFGSKEQLFTYVCKKALNQAFQDRGQVLTGDITSAVKRLVEHYEKWGGLILRLQAQAEQIAAVGEVTAAGRTAHYRWVEHTFAYQLERLSPSLHRRRLAQLIAVTDIHIWKVLRHDLGFNTDETEEAFVEVITPLVLQTD